MKNKTLQWFLAGALLGAVVCANIYIFFLAPKPAEPQEFTLPPPVPPVARLEALEKENELLKKQLAELEKKLEARNTPVNLPPPPSRPPDFRPDSPPPSGPPPNFEEMVKRARNRQFDNQMRQLKSALGLTDNQLALLDEAVAAYLDRNDGNPAGLLGLGAMAEGGQMRQILDPLMSPDQEASLGEYMATERGNQIEIMTNAQLMQLQSLVSLSEEQKDQAFSRFAEMAEARVDEQLAGGDMPGGQAARVNAFFQDNAAAMETILTPEQMEIYQQAMEQQRQMVEQFRRRAEGNSGSPGNPGTPPPILAPGSSGSEDDATPGP